MALKELKDGIVDYIQHKSALWRLLKVSRPDMFAVANKASYLDRKDEEIKVTWKKYESEFASRFPLAHLVYGIFKEQFMNSPVEGVNYLSKYFMFKQNKKIEEEKLLNPLSAKTKISEVSCPDFLLPWIFMNFVSMLLISKNSLKNILCL